jgi:hypothetical protein
MTADVRARVQRYEVQISRRLIGVVRGVVAALLVTRQRKEARLSRGRHAGRARAQRVAYHRAIVALARDDRPDAAT